MFADLVYFISQPLKSQFGAANSFFEFEAEPRRKEKQKSHPD